ncbi:DUF262 domain-containing protein [Cellulophaga baltica]|uniref:DUF262 domain-containing protein n=1 Tax=Cellulophaga baltica TaxID=76594 RepID=UPI0015F3B192|nr:DUF262 domain-containing protein [Cellulophaga baltica]MBA6315171.1 DUF262 domain-containing protein [Cellulophaga baltica]
MRIEEVTNTTTTIDDEYANVSTKKSDGLHPSIITVSDLLSESNITFPNYQRPYKWEIKNVKQLVNDITTFKDKPAYRLGTVVIHLDDDKEEMNIVDGQQRTITLILLAKAILANYNAGLLTISNTGLKEQLRAIQSEMPQPKFINEITIKNIQRNYAEIQRLVASFDEESVYFLFNKCEFVKCILTDISEAFQFFDAQNARGKDLDPHDLLKAFHLREFSNKEKEVLNETVATWENLETYKLVNLFGKYLFRIKGWIKGRSSRYFTKNEVDLFKGITLDKIENYPFTKDMRITHFYIDQYNQSIDRDIDLQKMAFPFQLDRPTINGKRFFEKVHYYEQIVNYYKGDFLENVDSSTEAKEILCAINNYAGKQRDGDQYVRTLFDCSLIYYQDKFGTIELSKFVELAFIWAYKVRLQQQSVYLSTADNYVLENNIFKVIHEAVEPHQVLNFYIPELHEVRIKNRKSLNYVYDNENKNLVAIFKNLRYYYGE